MRYPNASTEPLEIIRVNECDAEPGLATARFQALWNEIERLRMLTGALAREADLHLEAAREAYRAVGQA